MLTADKILIRNEETTGVLLDERYILLSIHTGCYFEFNRIASEIWKILDEPCRLSVILDQLSKNYKVDNETLSREVISFLDNLVRHRLVRVLQ
jgi:hypothetical protein